MQKGEEPAAVASLPAIVRAREGGTNEAGPDDETRLVILSEA